MDDGFALLGGANAISRLSTVFSFIAGDVSERVIEYCLHFPIYTEESCRRGS